MDWVKGEDENKDIRVKLLFPLVCFHYFGFLLIFNLVCFLSPEQQKGKKGLIIPHLHAHFHLSCRNFCRALYMSFNSPAALRWRGGLILWFVFKYFKYFFKYWHLFFFLLLSPHAMPSEKRMKGVVGSVNLELKLLHTSPALPLILP